MTQKHFQSVDLTNTVRTAIANLSQQSKGQVPVDVSPKIMIMHRIFRHGLDIDTLCKAHPRYSAEHQRIYPFYTEDDFGSESYWVDAPTHYIENVVYYWDKVTKSMELNALHANHAALVRAVNDLSGVMGKELTLGQQMRLMVSRKLHARRHQWSGVRNP
jgi:hypothetical protein